jgi:hypothetical protein
MPAQWQWWRRDTTARGSFLLGGVYLATGLVLLSGGLLARRGYWLVLAVFWLFFSAAGFIRGVAPASPGTIPSRRASARLTAGVNSGRTFSVNLMALDVMLGVSGDRYFLMAYSRTASAI